MAIYYFQFEYHLIADRKAAGKPLVAQCLQLSSFKNKLRIVLKIIKDDIVDLII